MSIDEAKPTASPSAINRALQRLTSTPLPPMGGPTSASRLESPEPSVIELKRENAPRPLDSLTAAAALLKGHSIRRPGQSQQWQEDAWDMYDLVGEQRFLAATLANRISQALLYVGKLPDDPTESPEKIETGKPHDVFEAFGGGPTGRSQILNRAGLNLFISGDGTILGLPEGILDGTTGESPADDKPAAEFDPTVGIRPTGVADPTEVDLTEFDWQFFSVSEIRSLSEERIQIQTGDGARSHVEVDLNRVYPIRVWRPHPRKWWQADSPTRASLPVLRELVGLTMHISSQLDSRIAGAGLLLVPQAASDAIKQQAGITDPKADPFTETLIEAMMASLTQRGTAADVVPVTATVPGETIEQFRFIKFWSDLDAEAKELRDEAIRRLALGQDAPPEILLGVGGMNHWGAWLVREDVVTTHIEPPLALICDALTTQYLWPVLEAQGMSAEEREQYVIWYDVDNLIQRPNRASDAFALHARGAISDASLRDATGFDDSDAPEIEKSEETSDTVGLLVMQMVGNNPNLAANPGLIELGRQIDLMVNGGWRDEVAKQEEQAAASAAALEKANAAAEAQQAEEPAGDSVGPPDTPGDTNMPGGAQ